MGHSAISGPAEGQSPRRHEVCLVVPPFAPLWWPPLGVCLMASALRKAGLTCKVFYANHWFARHIGLGLHELIINHVSQESGLCEWLFSRAAFPGFTPDDQAFLSQAQQYEFRFKSLLSLLKKGPFDFSSEMITLRRQAGEFVQTAAHRIAAHSPRLVACGSSYQQNCASLGLLRQVKEQDLGITTVMGGSNCEAEMGLALKREFDWLDYLISGEADLAFPALCEEVLRGPQKSGRNDPSSGVFSQGNLDGLTALREEKGVDAVPVMMLADLAGAPEPDYRDYFEELSREGKPPPPKVFLPFEGSRGCWKGAKQPCNFCGLNGKLKTFRHKSPRAILDQLARAHAKYGINSFMAADTILHMGFFNTLLKELIRLGAPYNLFYETSARLTESQVKLLARAGVRWIQPGIESLEPGLIVLLNKGNSVAGNIALLKYAREAGVRVYWNLLFNIPGERESQLKSTMELLPLLHHLQPPGAVPVSIHRFSPYERRESEFGLKLIPRRLYEYIYPVPPRRRRDLVYMLEDRERDATRHFQTTIHREFIGAVFEWRRRFWGNVGKDQAEDQPPLLTVEPGKHSSRIVDARSRDRKSEYELSGLNHLALNACHNPASFNQIMNACQCGQGSQLQAALEELCGRKLVVKSGDQYLSLALRPGFPPLPPEFPPPRES